MEEVVRQSLEALAQAVGESVEEWSFTDRAEAVGCLQPLLEPLVFKAVLAQAICSVMHPRLLRLVVPGWLSSSSSDVLSKGVAVPDAWGRWPGVAVFDPKVMDRGDGAPAVSEVFQASGNAPAAVFCGDVGVVQLASSVKELSGFVVQAGGEAVAGDLGGDVVRVNVLKKPRVYVAFGGSCCQ